MIDAERLRPFLATTLDGTHFDFLGERYAGKVRDVYAMADRSVLVSTDRQSAFDISWCTVPLKGQVLNQLSAWWFAQVADIMPTHLLSVPDPNAMAVKPLTMLRVEIVVRGYLTGSTSTSAWMHYRDGARDIAGNILPDGMVKNERLPSPIITPTTKAEEDLLISPAEIVEQGLATEEQWADVERNAFALFARGQQIAKAHGLILVDTKYEMGFDADGTLTLGDEVHTPDSSRYWIDETYEERFAQGKEPESLDKEFFRLWLREQGFEYGGPRPAITDDVRLMLAQKYIDLYERMTGEPFLPPEDADVTARIERNLRAYAGGE